MYKIGNQLADFNICATLMELIHIMVSLTEAGPPHNDLTIYMPHGVNYFNRTIQALFFEYHADQPNYEYHSIMQSPI